MQAQARPRGDCSKRECVLAVDEARYEYGSQAQHSLLWPGLALPRLPRPGTQQLFRTVVGSTKRSFLRTRSGRNSVSMLQVGYNENNYNGPDNTGNTGTLDSGMSREICSSIFLFSCFVLFSFWHVCKSKQMLHFLLRGGSLLQNLPSLLIRLCCLPAWLVMSSIRSSQMANHPPCPPRSPRLAPSTIFQHDRFVCHRLICHYHRGLAHISCRLCPPLSLSPSFYLSLSFFISLFLSLSTLHSLQLQHENCHGAIRSRANISYNRVVNTSGSTRRADLAVWDRTTQRSS